MHSGPAIFAALEMPGNCSGVGLRQHRPDELCYLKTLLCTESNGYNH